MSQFFFEAINLYHLFLAEEVPARFIRPFAFPASKIVMPPAGPDQEYEWQHEKGFMHIKTLAIFLSKVR